MYDDQANERKVKNLDRLVYSSDIDAATYPENARAAAVQLEDIAAVLRDPSTREKFGGTDVPSVLVKIVNTPLPAVDAANYGPHLQVLEQVGRVAANLVADCDVNRDRLATAGEGGYPLPTLQLITKRPLLPLQALRPLVASLLNLTVERHGPSVAALSSHDNLVAVMTLAGAVYTPGAWAEDDADARSGVAAWLWTIADNLIDESSAQEYSLAAADVRLFLPPLQCAAPREAPVDDDGDCFSTDLTLLTHATRVLERFNAADKLDHKEIMGDTAAMEQMLDFVELALIPSWVEVDDDEPGDSEKTLGVAKASIARTVVSLLAEAGDVAPTWVWERVQAWLDMNDRADLVACALLSYGNRARSDAAAKTLVSEPGLVARLVKLLVPGTPVIVQHALLGLLRNLSIPADNKRILGAAGVVEGVVALDPWCSARDPVGSVQGGAIGVIKNLVREPVAANDADKAANSVRFLAPVVDAVAAAASITEINDNDDGILSASASASVATPAPGPEALHAMIARTNDPALAMEGTRVWAAAIRALASVPLATATAAQRTAWSRVSSARVLADLARMLVAGEQHIVLVNEGVVALSLLAAFGSGSGSDGDGDGDSSSAAAIDAALMQPQAVTTKARVEDAEVETGSTRRGADVLARVLAPRADRPVAAEVQAGAVTLVRLLNGGAVRGVCAREIALAGDEGRSVAAGAAELAVLATAKDKTTEAQQ